MIGGGVSMRAWNLVLMMRLLTIQVQVVDKVGVDLIKLGSQELVIKVVVEASSRLMSVTGAALVTVLTAALSGRKVVAIVRVERVCSVSRMSVRQCVVDVVDVQVIVCLRVVEQVLLALMMMILMIVQIVLATAATVMRMLVRLVSVEAVVSERTSAEVAKQIAGVQ